MTSPTPPSTDTGMPSHAAMRRAAEWYALLNSGSATPRDHARWQRWLASSTMHEQAWGYVQAVSRDMSQLQGAVDRHVLSGQLIGAHQRLQRRRSVMGLVAAVGLAGGTWTVWRYTPLPSALLAWRADHSTATGTVRAIVLPDASRLWLNSASAINVDFSADLRRIELVQGEALISTAPDGPTNRPFVVDTAHGRLQALGTRFSVRLMDAHTRLTVLDKVVAVWPKRLREPLRVQAGEQVDFNATQVQDRQSVPVDVDSWVHGVVQAHAMPLGALAAELGRYYRGHIDVAAEIAHLRVVGSFAIGDVPRSLTVLESVLPVRVHQTLPGWIRIAPR